MVTGNAKQHKAPSQIYMMNGIVMSFQWMGLLDDGILKHQKTEEKPKKNVM